ncbi:MAG TPA: hypothetical protein VH187_01665 [Scandinavium sp.]|jgi:hypothetical protein|uniref:hypothetical protein n=1 Tax=Scandinavium sp. TaxID=2830653 RepID=UPI002E32388C|nr:hypothetical protein [Scandinavium sp.]HEX4499866.1 hypothetical protein [Scandinavium sp.]
MSGTPNLSLGHLLASQSQKDVTVNQSLDGLDQAVAGTTSLDVSAGGTFTLTSAQWLNLRLLLTGTPSATVTIRLPINKKSYIVDNHCGQTATVGYTSGTTVNVSASTMAWLYFDGTNALLLNTAGSGGVSSFNTRTGAVTLTSGDVTGAGGALLASPTFTGTPAAPTATAGTNTTQVATTAYVTAAIAALSGSGPYDVGVYLSGTYTNSQIIGEYIFPRTVNFPASMTGSYAQADTASSGTVSCTVTKNGTSIGTVQFAASASGTFVSFSATTFNASDLLKITAPSAADAALAGVKITLVGTR